MMFSKLVCLGLVTTAGASTSNDAEVLLQVAASPNKSSPNKSGSALADRIAAVLTPRVTSNDCGGFVDQGQGGAFYRWCSSVLNASVARNSKDKNLLGLSYGIFTWDSWSRRLSNEFNVSTKLYDCYTTAPFKGVNADYKTPYDRHDVCVAGTKHVDMDGRQFEALHDHLSVRPARGTFVKMDVEGSEWEALKHVTDDDLKKIDLLDMEIHFCKEMGGVKDHQAELADRIKTLERLTQIFHVTGRDPAAPSDPDYTADNMKHHRGHDGAYANRLDADVCGDIAYPGPKGGDQHRGMLSVSFVNRALLKEPPKKNDAKAAAPAKEQAKKEQAKLAPAAPASAKKEPKAPAALASATVEQPKMDPKTAAALAAAKEQAIKFQQANAPKSGGAVKKNVVNVKLNSELEEAAAAHKSKA
jgi:hypothetical protein